MKFIRELKGDGRVRVEAERLDAFNWPDLWRFRELLLSLAWRDFLVRYKQTAIGILWAVLDPLISMAVLVLIFGVIAKMPETTPVTVFAAMLPWQLFNLSLNAAALCLVNNQQIVSKIYFPRIILPFSSVLVNFVDLLINFGILLGLMLLWGVVISWKVILVIPIASLAIVMAFGLGLFVSSLYVRYRDFKMLIPFLLKIGLLVTPIGYQMANKSDTIQVLMSLNPMTGIVEACRWAVLPNYEFFAPSLFVTLATILFLVYFGIRYFRRAEKWFADLI